MLPLAAYIRLRLRPVSARAVDVGAFALAVGAVSLILAGLIVSHPLQGAPVFPRLHEMLARMAAIALGAGLVLFWMCSAKAYLARSSRSHEWGWLMVCWSLLALPALSIALLRAAVAVHLDWSNPIYQGLQSRALWRLGLWEWFGSAAVFLFLFSAALFLAESAPGVGGTVLSINAEDPEPQTRRAIG
jgi:hypothetical protein